ncbi:NADH oxidase [Exophiala viscosa]|uniref:NADH oxidase n=1 Tax=Exophiala viscosa TaxID=2486360 RepID=A0AAN6IAM7_9EURO|nr:NADH oxidase [Exophiala viscosa]
MASQSSLKIPSTMRACQFSSTKGGLEKNLVLNESASLPPHDDRALGKDKALVQVLAASLNPVDYKLVELPVVGRLAVKTPSSPGLDLAGRVIALGAANTAAGLEVGQLVFGRLDQPTQFGTLAEYTVAPVGALAKIPEGVTVQDAACVGTAGLTAYQSIAPNVKRGSGSRVFINGGSGGTGVWGIQIAKALGCHVVTSCSGKNAQFCKELGADEVVDYTSEDVLEALKKKVGVSGQKFDLVVDNVGTSAGLYWNCHLFTNDGAKFVVVGADPSGRTAYEMATKMLWPGFLGGGKRKMEVMMVQGKREQLGEIGTWLKEGKVKAVVDQIFRMEDAAKAFERLKTNRAKGKIVVAVSE